MKNFPSMLESFGIQAGSELNAEIQDVMDATSQPGPFLVYIHSDPCPDNVFDLGERFYLIDFEFSRYGHALWDAIYPRMVWPTCWCANRLPAQTVARMETHYRAELIQGCPQAAEDAVWESELIRLCGFALLHTLAFDLEEAANENHEWGLATIRQRALARLDAFIAAAEEFRRLPRCAGWPAGSCPFWRRAGRIRSRLPLYPAFRDG